MAGGGRISTTLRRGALSASVTFAACGCSSGEPPLAWADEFDGNTLDQSKWEPMIGTGTLYGLPPGWGNEELQHYTDDPANLFVQDGLLHIVARKQQVGGAAFTSARIRTKALADFTYGRIEARIRFPRGQGIWPAFWMLPTDSPYGGWAASGEIDVVETVNDATTAHATIHFGGQWPANTRIGGEITPGEPLSDGFHVYAVEWEPESIRWYMDDTLYFTATSDQWWSENGEGNSRAPFDVPFHLLLNVAVGGFWPGPPDDTTEFPVEMQVDWVRVYDIASYPFLGSPHAVPGRIEAEDFDEGYAAYEDCDPGNNGGAYRQTDVDVEPASEGGFDVGWVCPGEWLAYAVTVGAPGEHMVRTRVASQSSGGLFRLDVDGEPVTEPIVVPPTGGWQAWVTVEAPASLAEGEHRLRWVNLGDANEAYNVNWFEFIRSGCGADVNGDGELSVLDFVVFQAGWQDHDPAADCDGSGTFNVLDFVCFQQLFQAGCG